MSSGFAVFYHNETSDSLEIFFEFSSVIDIIESSESSSGFTSQFSLGPYDGEHWWEPSEGRETSMIPGWLQPEFNILGGVAKASSQNVPSDYSLLHSTREELGCGDAELAHVVHNSQELRDVLGLITKLDHLNAMDLLSAVPKASEAYSAASTWMLCAVEYLRPVHDDSAALMTPLMIMGFLHVLMELSPESVSQVVESNTIWNTVGGKLIRSS